MKFTCKYVNTFFPKDTKHVRHNYYLVWIPSSKILVNEVETVSINLKSAIDNILCFHRQTFNTQNVIPCSISITFLSQWRYWNILLLLKFMSEMLWEHFPPRNAFRLDTSDQTNQIFPFCWLTCLWMRTCPEYYGKPLFLKFSESSKIFWTTVTKCTSLWLFVFNLHSSY